ncbi:2-polyprenyl-6-methoxyphenol hydroxylase-like FAD-dependent oxidoreductase [Sinomonas atrocyanea]|uniref:FAD-dependent monooxygenase n=1 Tax=Sinomonas atrocyanea TaxID=37927 RepID=UPI00278425D6|nr:FAD-dependent monooxygenase [Sinomonas atrocyanea]MDQ0258627.1 2-polyprenyl-6-methoxyphenol hydroxylase-like FAD-dependent oxidoreductase [Sinomonas atrocyanea]
MKGTAVIVGAGIAGLAAARSLAEGGWEVEVHERHPQLSTAGTLLGLWPAAWSALERLGAAAGLETVSIASGELLRPDGRVLGRLSLPETSRGVGRMDLLETLLAGLPEGTVRWGSPVASPAQLPDADVVVAADGVHSALRAHAFPAARLRDAKVVAFRGVAPLETRDGFEAWGAGLIFGRAPFPGGGTNWYAGVRTDLAGTREDDPLGLLGALYRGWTPRVHEVLTTLAPEAVDRRRIEDLAPLKSYVAGNLALVGDAAHAMAPHLGRGGGESLMDGLALADALVAAPSVAEGLARYDAARRRPSQRAVAGSRLMNRISNQLRHPWLRDTLVTAAGKAAARRRPTPSSAE